jgi:hypothetical protein
VSELSARLSLYKAIDEAVQSDPGKLAAAAQVIPAYRGDLKGMAPAVGWYDKFEQWAGGDVPQTSDRDDALEFLGETSPKTPSDAAHRVRTLWATGRVFPEDELDSDLLGEALKPVVGHDRSDAVARRVRQPEAAPRREDLGRLHDFLGRSPSARGASAPVADLVDAPSDAADSAAADLRAATPGGATMAADVEGAGPQGAAGTEPSGGPSAATMDALCPPSESDFVQVDVPVTSPSSAQAGAPELAVRIVTPGCRIDVGPTGKLDLSQVRERIHPERWSSCYSSFWCSMDPVGDPKKEVPFRYTENVGECEEGWTMFSPCLKFAWVPFANPGQMTRLEYALCDPAAADPSKPKQILVDRGWITVRLHDEGGRQYATVETLKIVYFAPPLTGAPLAIALEALGYGEGARTMMTTCLNN